MRAFEFLIESKPGKQAMSYKRSNRYPDGENIPDSLPDRYQPASFPGVPANQKCSNCEYYETSTKKCSKFKGDPVVRPAYWCAKWEIYKEELTEGKKKGKDGKACWKGYRYNGTKNGKDSCVKVKEDVAPVVKKVGREFNHLEDLVFTEHNGAQRALDILRSLAEDSKDISIKWDGNPTVYWGREPDGQFRMVGKNNWGREEGKSSSPEELRQFIMSRGKGEDWREKFANDMASLWPIFEAGTPKDFRGYVYGDILFHPGKPYQGANGKLSFTPNQTTYEVKATSPIGQRLGKAKVAIAAHKLLDYFGDKSGDDLTDVKSLNASPALVVFGQTYVSHQPAVSAENIGTIERLVKSSGAQIDKMLAPIPGLSDLKTILYTFVNNQSKAKALDQINTNSFFQWMQGSKVSAPKQAKIADINKTNAGVMDALFALVREIMKAKDELIAELDSAGGDITAHTGGKPGGEGYMHTGHGVKLVPRDRWTPFRAD